MTLDEIRDEQRLLSLGVLTEVAKVSTLFSAFTFFLSLFGSRIFFSVLFLSRLSNAWEELHGYSFAY